MVKAVEHPFVGAEGKMSDFGAIANGNGFKNEKLDVAKTVLPEGLKKELGLTRQLTATPVAA